MKSLRIPILSVVAALVIGATVLFAQGMHGHGGPDGEFGHMLGFYADALDLSSAQQDQIKAIWQKEKPTMKPLMQQMHQNRAAIDALAEASSFDEAKTRALATQNAQTMIDLAVEHARMKNEMLQVLTPDQKTKYQQLEARHQARMQKHMQSAAPPAND
ncbi:MAG: Spy/CpxP family protein refolding chaperone [Terriglobales bacterium]